MDKEIKAEQPESTQPVKKSSSRDFLDHIARLTQENEALKSESKKHRIGKREVGEEAAQLRADLEKVNKQLETFRKQIDSTPDELRQELESYRAELRSLKHKDAFRSVAKGLGVREEALDDAFALSGYKAEDDDVNPEYLKEIVGSTLATRPYLKGEVRAEKPKLTPGLGVSRGAASKSGFAPSQEQLQDPVWLFHNQKKLAEAARDGTFVNPFE
jgi:hypothetical protein